jgi:hypothetical protein
MVRPNRDRLTGRVGVDETYLGGLEEGVRGRQTERKALSVVAAEEDGPGIGRIRMRRIADDSAETWCLLYRTRCRRTVSSTPTAGWATSPWAAKITITRSRF